MKTPQIQRIPEYYSIDFGDLYPHGLNVKQSPVRTASNEELAFIAGQHYLDQTKLQNIIAAFFTQTVPAPFIKKLSEIQTFVNAATGTGQMIFDWNENDHTTNNDIALSSAPFTKTRTIYSGDLFRGILLLYTTITEFHFFKAIDNGNNTIAIIAIDSTSKVLYSGELSVLYP